MKRQARLFVEDILESISKIEDYTRDLNQEEFFRNSLAQDAVIRRLEIMGEGCKEFTGRPQASIS